MGNVIQVADRCCIQVVTVKPFRRPKNPTRCSLKRFHVWRWRGGPQAPRGLQCQCGLLDVSPRMPLTDPTATDAA